jgi:hypothetical protein
MNSARPMGGGSVRFALDQRIDVCQVQRTTPELKPSPSPY